MVGKIVSVDKDLKLSTKQSNGLKANNVQAFMRKLLRFRNSSSRINDLTVGNNEAIATILVNTRVIGQQARSYDIGINTIAHEFALVTTSIFADTYTGNIQSKTKKISQTKVYVGQIKRESFVLYQLTRSVILYTCLLMIRQRTMWTIWFKQYLFSSNISTFVQFFHRRNTGSDGKQCLYLSHLLIHSGKKNRL